MVQIWSINTPESGPIKFFIVHRADSRESEVESTVAGGVLDLYFTKIRSSSKEGSYLRLIDLRIIQLLAGE